jgi:hypothetical protein
VPINGLFGHGFGPRVNHPVADGRIIGPARHQAPPQ